ncbi:putative NADH dehydrogenase/NAD(P)H nitroreductase AF_0226 [Gammaproteobacteria bacterium]
MLDFFATVRYRHSVRRYHADLPIEPEKLHAVLEAACAAPSAGDLQAYRIVVITSQAGRDALRQAANDQPFVSEAPVCAVFCADPRRSAERFGDRGAHLYALQDATIAAAYAQLAIVAMGLGSTWVGYFDDAKVTQLLKLDAGVIPVALLSIGYPAELPEPTTRRILNDIVSYRSD